MVAQLFTIGLAAQNTAITDSLEKLLPLTRSDTAKAMLLYRLSDEWSLQDAAKALRYLREGMRLSARDPFYQGIGYFYQGRLLMDYDQARATEAFDKGLRLFEGYATQDAYLYQSRSWADKAALAQWNNDNKRYIELTLNKAIPLAAKAGDSIRIAQGYTNIGIAFMNDENFDRAIFYLQASAGLFRRLAPVDGRQIDNYADLAKIYVLTNQLPAAKRNLDSASPILKQQPQSQYAPYYYTIEGMYYRMRKDWGKAEESIELGLAVAESLKSPRDIVPLLYQRAMLYDNMKDFSSQKRTLLKMLDEGYITQDVDRKITYRSLAYADSALGNMNAAYGWMLRYNDLADSLYQKDTRLKIADLDTRYNYAQKEKELLIAKNKAKTQRLLVWASLCGLLLMVVFFLIVYRLRQAKARQELQSLKQQQEIALTQALLAGEEKERMRIAQDLHDGLGGMLAGVKINLTNALPENTSAEMDRVIGQLDNSVTELRRIARNMMPRALLQSGLEAALSQLCEATANDRLKVYSRFMNLRSNLTTPVQLIIYRIAQELLANVIKHAQATEVFVQGSQDRDIFYLTVEDNGRGYTPSDREKGNGVGLENIKSRVDFLKGKMDISGGPGKGTIINIELNTDEKR